MPKTSILTKLSKKCVYHSITYSK